RHSRSSFFSHLACCAAGGCRPGRSRRRRMIPNFWIQVFNHIVKVEEMRAGYPFSAPTAPSAAGDAVSRRAAKPLAPGGRQDVWIALSAPSQPPGGLLSSLVSLSQLRRLGQIIHGIAELSIC